jgi:hypothetical protein
MWWAWIEATQYGLRWRDAAVLNKAYDTGMYCFHKNQLKCTF